MFGEIARRIDPIGSTAILGLGTELVINGKESGFGSCLLIFEKPVAEPKLLAWSMRRACCRFPASLSASTLLCAWAVFVAAVDFVRAHLSLYRSISPNGETDLSVR